MTTRESLTDALSLSVLMLILFLSFYASAPMQYGWCYVSFTLVRATCVHSRVPNIVDTMNW